MQAVSERERESNAGPCDGEKRRRMDGGDCDDDDDDDDVHGGKSSEGWRCKWVESEC